MTLMTMIEPLHVYTFRELCAVLGVSPHTARDWLRAHGLYEVAVGKRHRILGRHIIEALNEIIEELEYVH